MIMRLITLCCIVLVSITANGAETVTELPKEFYGVYTGEPKNVVQEAKSRNIQVLPYKRNIITLKGGRTIQWKMQEAITGTSFSYAGIYTVKKEDSEKYTLHCVTSYREKTATVSIAFTLLVYKTGKKATYVQIETGRKFDLAKQ